jgi:hypothetical protein
MVVLRYLFCGGSGECWDLMGSLLSVAARWARISAFFAESGFMRLEGAGGQVRVDVIMAMGSWAGVSPQLGGD